MSSDTKIVLILKLDPCVLYQSEIAVKNFVSRDPNILIQLINAVGVFYTLFDYVRKMSLSEDQNSAPRIKWIFSCEWQLAVSYRERQRVIETRFNPQITAKDKRNAWEEIHNEVNRWV